MIFSSFWVFNPFIWTLRPVPASCSQVILWTTLIIQAENSKVGLEDQLSCTEILEDDLDPSIPKIPPRNWNSLLSTILFGASLVFACAITKSCPVFVWQQACIWEYVRPNEHISRFASKFSKRPAPSNRSLSHLEMIEWIFPRLQNLWRYRARLSLEWSTIPWRHSLFVPRGAPTYCKASSMSRHARNLKCFSLCHQIP